MKKIIICIYLIDLFYVLFVTPIFSSDFTDKFRSMNPSLCKAKILDENRFLVVGEEGTVLFSSDAGNSWNNSFSNRNFIKDIALAGNGKIFIIGSSGIVFKSEDTCKTWIKEEFPEDIPINTIKFFDNKTGIIAGDTSSFYRTTDGGESWSLIKCNFGIFIYSSYFIDSNKLIFTGYNSKIFYSSDFGDTWQQSLMDTSTENCYPVNFSRWKDSIYLQYSNRLLKSSDGGKNWSTKFFTGLIPAGLSNFFNGKAKIIFSTIGCFINAYEYDCETGTISNLTPDNSKMEITGYSIPISADFLNQTTGLVVGTNSTILKTTDGGSTFEVSSNIDDSKISLRNIFFLNKDTGFFASVANRIFKTTDGGALHGGILREIK